MPPGEEWDPSTIHLGPTLVDIPANWEVLDGGGRGTVVLKMPLEQDSAMQQLMHIPGYVQPNLVFRFFPMAADQGGVARAAGDELRAARHHSPGASLLAVTPFSTRAGFPGRAQLIVGIYQRVPYQMSRWYIGVGDTVVEIVLTLPGTFQPELMQLGEMIAETVRADPAGSEASATGNSSLPEIPPTRLDDIVSDQFNTNKDGVHLEGGLERIERTLEGVDRNRLPGRGGILSGAAVEHLENTAKLGTLRRLSSGSHPEDEELAAMELVEGGRLSEKGRHLTSGMKDEPDIVLSGRRERRSTQGRIWMDGEEATLLLGPTGRDLTEDPYSLADDHHAHRELALSVPVILDSWTANEATWFIDITIDCSVAELDAILTGEGVSERLRTTSSPLVMQILSEGLTSWTSSYKNSGNQFQWLCSSRRGPFLVSSGETPDSVQLSSTTASFIHDSLATLLLYDSNKKYSST